MSQDVAIQFNPMKPNEEKTKVFVDTYFYTIIKGNIIITTLTIVLLPL